MHLTAAALVVVLSLLAFQEPALKSPGLDFSKVDRTIKKQPAYVDKPQYALLLLGPEGKTRIWMALDKSKAGAGDHDVLYIDRDGDGELGEAGEQVSGVADNHGRTVMSAGKVEFPDAKFLLEDIQVYSYVKESMTFVSFKLNGSVKVYSAYGPGSAYLRFGESPEKAPILHVDPWGTLAFFHAGPTEMKVGQQITVMLYVGTQGWGPASFTAVDERFLDLEKDKLIVTLIAKDRQGNEIRKKTQLKDHC